MKIAVFDSGVGGLTVVKDILKAFPNASICYVGDTARVPYGTRSRQTIRQYARQISGFLFKQKIDILVVACNTVSSVALREIKKMSKVPVVGMIKPVTDEAVNFLGCRKIGVIGTNATINSRAYKNAIQKLNKKTKVIEMACPLFVPIAEEDLGKDEVAYMMARKYLRQSLRGVDCLILGCTHYPLLLGAIQKVLDKKVKILTCGEPAARKVGKLVGKVSDVIQKSRRKPKYVFYATDDPKKFQQMAKIFLGKKITKVKKLDLEKIV